MKFISQNGMPVEQAVKELLQKKASALRSLAAAKVMRESLKHTVRNHFKTVYPGSKHWSPDNVVDGEASTSSSFVSASANVEVAGASRAYHNVTIVPKFRKWLTLPMHTKSYGKKAADFSDLLFIQKKNGNAFLAQKEGIGLDFLFALKKKVFQKQDKRLMPSDSTLATNIFSRLKAYLQRVN